MTGRSRFTASAVVGGLVLLCTAVAALAQSPGGPDNGVRLVSLASGSLQGVVQDEKGLPVNGALVSALGATTATATTDRSGRFVMVTLLPGPYFLRAHLSGFIASRGQYVEVRPSSRTSSAIALRHAADAANYHMLAAGAAGNPEPAQPGADIASNDNDDHGETAWRLRHARRGILRDATVPEDVIADDTPETSVFEPVPFFGGGFAAPMRIATNYFSDTVFTGQVNLLTTGSFDTPQQLFTVDGLSRGVAYMSVSAPAGSSGDWTVRAALTQGDITSWIVAGSYTTRVAARNRYDIGMSYATQRYGAATTAAAIDGVADITRDAGALYTFDTFAVTPAISLTFGSRYAQYNYLENRGLLSPRVALTVTPARHLRVSTLVSSRAVAPGAEEFLPPGDTGIWLPPERTFSALNDAEQLHAERATHAEAEIERDFGASTISFRAFHQHVADQLVTMFGIQVPDAASAALGHYFIADGGGFDATGWSTGVRAAIAGHVHASVEYSLAHAAWTSPGDLAYILVVAPSAARLGNDRIQDVSTSVEAEVPETATRVLVLYRVSNGFARADAAGDDRPGFDGRFDVQVRQSLPFMNFSNAHWEMLFAVHNFFREAASDQSIYDELLVVHPPKRLVGGLTLRF